MKFLYVGAANCALVMIVCGVGMCCSSSRSLKDYAERKRQERNEVNATTLNLEKTNVTTTAHNGESLQDSVTRTVDELSQGAVSVAVSHGRRRNRRRLDAPYLGKLIVTESRVVRHSLTIGNFTLVKKPMMENYEAQKYCQRDGGQLALVRSHKDIEVLRTLLMLLSHEHDRYIFEAYVNIRKSLPHQKHNVYDYHGYDAVLESSLESAETLFEDTCTTLRKEGVFNTVKCSWSLAFFCESSQTTDIRL